jgi:hypothetical protein
MEHLATHQKKDKNYFGFSATGITTARKDLATRIFGKQGDF